MSAKLLRLTMAALVILLFSRFQEWRDSYHITLIAIAGFLTAIAAWLLSRDRSAKNVRRRIHARHREHPIRSVLLGGVLGAAWIAVTVCLTFVANRTGLEQLYVDSDRSEIEQRLSILEEAGNFVEASVIIERRLERAVTEEWGWELRERLYRDLVSAAKQRHGREAQRLLDKAISLADSHGIDPTTAQALLRNLELGSKLNSQSKSLADQGSQWARRHFATLVEWGDSQRNDLAERRSRYVSARDFGKGHNINTDDVEAKIKAVEAEIAARSPVALPEGTTARIERWLLDCHPPVIAVELTVANRDGSPNLSLRSKDFAAIAADGRQLPVYLGGYRPGAKTLRMVLLVDRSASTAGPAIEAAKSGIGVLLDSLEGRAEVKTFAFGETVTPLHDWSADMAVIKRAMAPVRAEGRTALLQSIDSAIRSFDAGEGHRAIVIFTDGRDTAGGPAVEELISRCQKQQIAVHAVGLATKDFDARLLQALADQTGGQLVTASRERELASRFEALATQLGHPRYRLVIPFTGDARLMRIRVGGANAIELGGSTAMAAGSGAVHR